MMQLDKDRVRRIESALAECQADARANFELARLQSWISGLLWVVVLILALVVGEVIQ